MTCICCGCELEMDTEVRRGKCASCSLGLCRCQNTRSEEAQTDVLDDEMADHECGSACVDDFDCYLIASSRAEDRADVVAKNDWTNAERSDKGGA